MRTSPVIIPLLPSSREKTRVRLQAPGPASCRGREVSSLIPRSLFASVVARCMWNPDRHSRMVLPGIHEAQTNAPRESHAHILLGPCEVDEVITILSTGPGMRRWDALTTNACENLVLYEGGQILSCYMRRTLV